MKRSKFHKEGIAIPCCINCRHHTRTYFNHHISIKCEHWNKTVKQNEVCDHHAPVEVSNGDDILSKHD